jgi:diguanylate cyclase (GGDEF)-like protein
VLAICKDITEQKRLESELKEMSIKDSLTNLYNQRYFYDRLEAEIERAKRQGHPLSLLLFDVDQFKTYNDCHGHLDGDKVLKAAGQVVVECTREHVDIGFRYGGDEFTVILPEASEEQALSIARRIRATFESRHFDNLTVSIGLMSYREGSSLRSFIRFTDAMMYDAKRSGGNRVYVYRPDAEPHVNGEDQPEKEASL